MRLLSLKNLKGVGKTPGSLLPVFSRLYLCPVKDSQDLLYLFLPV